MNWLIRLLANRKIAPTPDIHLGRYSDVYKETEHANLWTKALDQFFAQNYLASYVAFFQYLEDKQEQNLFIELQQDSLYFELFQGSKRIFGVANERKLTATAKIAQLTAYHENLLRRLLEKNFNLKYSRYGLDKEKNICITFDTYSLDASPYKLYAALKELATQADKQDDLLLEEFQPILKEIESEHLIPISDEEKSIKYQFIQQKIKTTFSYIEQHPELVMQYPGTIAYLFLDLAYTFDYLIQPQGYMMETLERIHRKYFEKAGNQQTKNDDIKTEFEQLLNRSKADYYKELYYTKNTFGITSSENHNWIVAFIEKELPNIRWYQENGYPKVALAIAGYIIGYCLFNYALPKPDRDLFELYYKIVEPQFFKSLGFQEEYYNEKRQKLNPKNIRTALDTIRTNNYKTYPTLSLSIQKLNFESLPTFVISYLEMVKGDVNTQK
jgi:hypothetical protein